MPRTKYPIFKCLHRGEKGFTLVELLIVIAILGIIAAVVVPNIGKFTEKGYVEAANAEVDAISTAAMGYYLDHDSCPATVAALVSEGYLSKSPVNSYAFATDECYIETGTAAGRFAGHISWNTTGYHWDESA
jgi:prepilin-type N-terminal cleavage/methylation domain-containing protein